MDAELASKGQESRGGGDSWRRAKSCRICDKDSCGKNNIRVYAVTSMISFLLALTMCIVALGVGGLDSFWLVVFLAAVPLAAGVSAMDLTFRASVCDSGATFRS